jgi:hypothetical protein
VVALPKVNIHINSNIIAMENQFDPIYIVDCSIINMSVQKDHNEGLAILSSFMIRVIVKCIVNLHWQQSA